jgi:hypothetical protein
MAGTWARAEGFSEMPKYRFNPPRTLKGGVVVRTLDDAAAFVRSYWARLLCWVVAAAGHTGH